MYDGDSVNDLRIEMTDKGTEEFNVSPLSMTPTRMTPTRTFGKRGSFNISSIKTLKATISNIEAFKKSCSHLEPEERSINTLKFIRYESTAL